MTPAVDERIGPYRIHPAAALFPLLEDDDTDFETLKSSIKDHGQLLPILVQGDVLFDGRNRYRACVAVGVTPWVQEYTGPLVPSELIAELNLSRRDLTPQQRAIIVGKIYVMTQAERKALAQKAAGQQYGKGHPKLETDSSPANDEPKTRAKDARSTMGRVAEEAGVSMHVARQAAVVAKHPDLARAVTHEGMPLHKAAKQARERTAKPAPERKPTRRKPHTEKRRFITVFSGLRGSCMGIRKGYMDADLVAQALSPEETREWVREIRECTLCLRKFASDLEAAKAADLEKYTGTPVAEAIQ